MKSAKIMVLLLSGSLLLNGCSLVLISMASLLMSDRRSELSNSKSRGAVSPPLIQILM